VCEDIARAHPNTTVEAIVIPSIDVCEAIEEAENLMRAEESRSTAGPTSRAAGGARASPKNAMSRVKGVITRNMAKGPEPRRSIRLSRKK
jgi:hypothetical protein